MGQLKGKDVETSMNVKNWRTKYILIAAGCVWLLCGWTNTLRCLEAAHGLVHRSFPEAMGFIHTWGLRWGAHPPSKYEDVMTML